MQKLLRETGIAILIYFSVSWGLGFGIDEGQGWPEAAMSAAVFGVLYFLIGLVIRWFKGRSS
ncbi:hypothetical protein [Sulfitobacter donghicola]|uniref:Uncharacterized protein n=1 Tax=Sulfitobacter donghicola DSW-25 = KCTC 12864 = JCM 14565 TaxID=1300350 RepID=A0A073IGC7_9RHOB|nr:hypothetical protein [Sulfitobacter donghicola]KEJ88585.1 hypothetical protein DSW25_15440 [Sulfitobacter donghicola DSW-25 = KCTC 12864 = JCM 14565]KIN69643.1 hypothetical protein Z948_3391 [Sulfitobacter donghicola DSW-25 = KCTC 12864 = JCM 14565]